MACKIKKASRKWDEMVDRAFEKMGKKLSEWDRQGIIFANEAQNLLHDVSNEFFIAQNALYEQTRRAKEQLSALTKEQSKLLVRALNGDGAVDRLDKHTKKLYDTFRAEIDRNADELIKAGALKEKNKINDYLKRYYQKYVEDMSFVKKTILNQKYKARNGKLSLDQRIAMGMIEDASSVIPNTILEQKMQLLRAKNFEKLELLFAEEKEQSGYVQVPTQEMGGGVLKYGALSGKWIPKDMFNAINDTSAAARSLGVLERNWYPIIDHIKQNVTIKNPFTHAYNIGSNIVLAGIRGEMPALFKVLTMPKEQYKALQDRANALGLNTMLNDIDRPDASMLRSQNSVLDAILVGWQNVYMAKGSKVGDKVRAMYEWEDKIFKLAAFQKGLDDFRAEHKRAPSNVEQTRIFKDANSAYVDYSTPMGALPRVLDKSGLLPFLHYTYKATPQVAKMMAKHPIKYLLFTSALSLLGASTLGSQNEQEENAKPFWAADKFNLLFAKEYVSLGNNWYFNAGRLVPGIKMGGINFMQPNEHGEMEFGGGFVGGIMRILQGKDPLGRSIGSKYDNLAELIWNRFNTAVKNYAPPVTVGRYAQGMVNTALTPEYVVDKKTGMTIKNPDAAKNSYKEPMTAKELALRAVGVRKFDGEKEIHKKANELKSEYKHNIKSGMNEADAVANYTKAALDLGVDATPPHEKGRRGSGIGHIAPRLGLD